MEKTVWDISLFFCKYSVGAIFCWSACSYMILQMLLSNVTVFTLPPATDSSLLMVLMTWIKLFLNIFSLVCMCFPQCMCVVSLLKWHNLFLKCFSFLVQLHKTRLSYVLSLLIYLTNLNLYQFTLACMLYKSFSWPLEHHVWGEDHMTGFACACNHHQQISSLVS